MSETTYPFEVIVEGGGYWTDTRTEDYEPAPLRMRLDPDAGVIDVSLVPVNDEGQEHTLAAVPVTGIAALLAHHFAQTPDTTPMNERQRTR